MAALAFGEAGGGDRQFYVYRLPLRRPRAKFTCI
jgi:hypothetical protein